MAAAGPLAGIRVLDLTHILAGPFCTQLMADAGAQVIKIEPPGGEYSRIRGPQRRGPDGAFLSSYSAGVNRGKPSLEVDLKRPAGLTLLERLLPLADVLIDNFAPGALGRLGISQAALRDRYPRLVTASISLWGVDADDELGRRGGVAVVAEAESTMFQGRFEVDGSPFPVGFALGDMTSGLACYGAIVTALNEREVSGKGRHVQIAMVRNLLALNTINIAIAAAGGGAGPATAAVGLFPAADGWVAIDAHADSGWRGLCAAIGASDLDRDATLAGPEGREDRAGEINDRIRGWSSGRPVEAVLAALGECGVPAGRVRSHLEAAASPTFDRLGFLWDLEDGLGGTIKAPGNPFGFDHGKRRLPLIGEGAAGVLHELLGIDDEELAALAAAGAFGPAACL